PAGLLDRGGELRWRVENRIAGGRGGRHRRLDMTQRDVRLIDVRLYLREHRREVVVAAAPILERLLPYRRVDQEVAARLDHERHWMRRCALGRGMGAAARLRARAT